MTLRRTDLGSAGGWEEAVGDARLLPDGGVLILFAGTGGNGLERRRLDGTTAWSVPLLPEDAATLALQPLEAASDGFGVLVLEPSWYRDPDHPHLTVRRFDLETGTEAPERIEQRLDFVGLEVPEAVCQQHAEATASTLLCDGSPSPPLRIVLRDGTVYREPGSPPTGTMTTWRFDA